MKQKKRVHWLYGLLLTITMLLFSSSSFAVDQSKVRVVFDNAKITTRGIEIPFTVHHYYDFANWMRYLYIRIYEYDASKTHHEGQLLGFVTALESGSQGRTLTIRPQDNEYGVYADIDNSCTWKNDGERTINTTLSNDRYNKLSIILGTPSYYHDCIGKKVVVEAWANYYNGATGKLIDSEAAVYFETNVPDPRLTQKSISISLSETVVGKFDAYLTFNQYPNSNLQYTAYTSRDGLYFPTLNVTSNNFRYSGIVNTYGTWFKITASGTHGSYYTDFEDYCWTTRVNSVSYYYNQWEKHITLNWESKIYEENNDGKYYIWRYPYNNDGTEGTGKLLTPDGLSNATREYIDKSSDLEYDKKYKYIVCFVPTVWIKIHDFKGPIVTNSMVELYSSTTVTTTRSFDMNLTMEEKKTSVLLSTDYPDNPGNITFNVLRKAPGGTYTKIYQERVSKSGAGTFTYEDKDIAGLTSYTYKIMVEEMDEIFYTNEVSGGITSKTCLTEIAATKGDYTGVVKLSWNVDQVGTNPTKFRVYRNLLGSDEDYSEIYYTTGTDAKYFYEDVTALPGQYYDYKIEAYAKGTGSDGESIDSLTSTMCDNGFCMSSGTLSGRVTYGTGTAVAGVKMLLTMNGEDNGERSQFYSMNVGGDANSGVVLSLDTKKERKLFTNYDGKETNWTLQMWVRPEQSTASYQDILSMSNDKVGIRLDHENKLVLMVNGDIAARTDKIPTDGFTNVTLAYEMGKLRLGYIDGLGKYQSVESTFDGIEEQEDTLKVVFGGSIQNMASANCMFKGYVDDIRVWSKALTEEEVLNSYNRLLNGNENGLKVYWPMDEGINGQAMVYDYSKTNGLNNNHHGYVLPGTKPSGVIPTSDQLSLYGLTDAQGNYTIRGVPFSGSGTTYTITPLYGIHEFSPRYLTRFVSASGLSHSGVDYTDDSSFEVSGYVYYANTTFPVDSAYIYVDGNISSKDGELLMTNGEGKFTISVPIGKHFITIKKDGHVFRAGGCFPGNANVSGEKYDFVAPKSDLMFFDETLVNFTGRVVGGSVESEKKLGFGLSKNNIGQVMIEMSPENINPSLNVTWDNEGNATVNADTLGYASSTSLIKSTAWCGAKVGGTDDTKKIYILTDPKTGEFSAKVPPLKYNITNWRVLKNGGICLGNGVPVDMSNPLSLRTDTATYVNDKKETVRGSYDYCNSLIKTYTAEPTLEISQRGADAGMFGERTYHYESKLGDKEDIVLYDSDGYKFGTNGKTYPIFIKGNRYTFNIKCYERYENKDNGEAVYYDLPLAGDTLTVSNLLSGEHKTLLKDGTLLDVVDNKIVLDSLGMTTYDWQSGFPCISGDFTRSIEMYVDRTKTKWNGFKGIILGQLSTGNDFLTNGPDLVTMILRDPPGSNSFATWESGTVTSVFKSKGGTWTQEDKVTNNLSLGCYLEVYSGFGVAVGSKYDGTIEETNTIDVKCEGEAANVWTSESTIKKAISTSSDPEYVGANGDIFVGTSTNLIVGDANEVGIFKNSDGTYRLDKQTTTSISTKFKTDFAYTAQYIEGTLIPGWEALREQKLTLTPVSSQEEIESLLNTKNNSNDNLYYTLKQPSDPDFGAKGTYYVHYVNKKEMKDKKADEIEWINDQIANWKKYLAKNEEEKVRVNKNQANLLDKNLSFDAGTTITKTTDHAETISGYSTDITTGVTYGVEGAAGFKFNENGWKGTIENSFSAGYHAVTTRDSVSVNSFSYTLADSDASDALTVDVYNSDSNFGPIFRTIAGRTSNPYEGEVKTKYLETNEVIMKATKQIEKPEIAVSPSKLFNVPTGSAANFTLTLKNNSEIGEDIYYKLLTIDERNPYGAQFIIDGQTLTDNRVLKVSADQDLVKTLQIKQTDFSRMQYDSLAIVIASQGQYDPTSNFPQIADTAYISVEFIPSASPIKIAVDKSMVTTANLADGKPKLKVTMSEFNRNFYGQTNFVIQYKRLEAQNWTDGWTFLLDDKNYNPSNSSVIADNDATISHTFDMSSMTDGTYMFRIASNGNGTTVYSDEIKVIKDVARPKIIGKPQPADGILNAGDDIIITFNEDIAPDLIDKALAFRVQGILNEYEIAHDVALKATAEQTKAAATTSANINLSKKDFAIGMWVNCSGAGTILTHGKAESKFIISVDNNKKLAVSTPNGNIVSEADFPMNEWVYLALNYTHDGGGFVSAKAIFDTDGTSLFENMPVGEYYGDGPVAVLSNINANMHEFTLWDRNVSINELNSVINKSIKPSETNLIGYWKFDEGHGTASEDKARSRNMVLSAANGWYMNTKNYAAKLSGSNHIDISIQECPVADDEDYALEFWFLGTEDNAGKTLFTANKLSLDVTDSKSLKFTSGDYSMSLGNTNYCDGSWHHFALNVLRNGMATAYVDGEAVGQANAGNIKPLDGDALVLGAKRTGEIPALYAYSNYFKGCIDDVRIWKASMTGKLISDNRFQRLAGDEKGLVVYSPFDDESIKVDGPELKPIRSKSNVNYSYVASDRQIAFTLTDDPSLIEGCTIDFTVGSITDVHGNACEDIKWSVYVKQNQLEWAKKSIDIKQLNGSEATASATIVNRGATTESWEISNLPSWISVDVESGTLPALGEQKLTFTVSSAAQIGKYEETAFLSGNNEIKVPLTINVEVTGEEPLWAVDASGFSTNMTIFGQLKQAGKISENTSDMVAAFIDGECRGVAKPIYYPRYDTYFTLMSIYGNDDSDKDITFKVWNASEGQIYPIVACYENGETEPISLTFEDNATYGSFAYPFTWEAENKIEENLSLVKGWNWASLYVDNGTNNGVNTMLSTIKDSGKTIKGINGFSTNTGGTWGGQLETLEVGKMYMINMNSADTLTMQGAEVDPTLDKYSITLKKGWNWVGYSTSYNMSINDAFAGAATDGDQVKSQTAFSLYDGYEWVGTLKNIVPGQGYMYQKNDNENMTFNYPSKAGLSTLAKARTAKEVEYDMESCFDFDGKSYYKYQNNMTMVARVVDGDIAKANVEVAIVVNGEIRDVQRSNQNGLVFFTIPGNNDDVLHFHIADGNFINIADMTVDFESNLTYGTLGEPCLIQMGETTGLGTLTDCDDNSPAYSVAGHNVNSDTYRGIIISKGKKTYKRR